MFPCSADREGRAVSLVYSELISSPVSVTCGSLLKGKAQARQETHHVQARRVLSVCACHSRVLHMCVCALGFSLQRRRDSPDTRETEARSGPAPSRVHNWDRPGCGWLPWTVSFKGSFSCHHTLLQVRGFTLPRATLSLQKDILKTRTLVLSTLLPNRLGLWLVATAMDRPARLCPQLLPGLELAEAPDTVSQPSRLAARTWRERPRPQASGPVPRAPQKTQPGPPFPPGARTSQAHDQPDAHPPESTPRVPAAGAPAGLHPSGKL